MCTDAVDHLIYTPDVGLVLALIPVVRSIYVLVDDHDKFFVNRIQCGRLIPLIKLSMRHIQSFALQRLS